MIYFLWRHDGLWEWRHFTQPKENQKSRLTPNAHVLGILCNAVLRHHSVESKGYHEMARLSREGILNPDFLNGFPGRFVVCYQNCKINTLRKNSNWLCSWHLMRSSGHSHTVPLSFFSFDSQSEARTARVVALWDAGRKNSCQRLPTCRALSSGHPTHRTYPKRAGRESSLCIKIVPPIM